MCAMMPLSNVEWRITSRPKSQKGSVDAPEKARSCACWSGCGLQGGYFALCLGLDGPLHQ